MNCYTLPQLELMQEIIGECITLTKNIQADLASKSGFNLGIHAEKCASLHARTMRLRAISEGEIVESKPKRGRPAHKIDWNVYRTKDGKNRLDMLVSKDTRFRIECYYEDDGTPTFNLYDQDSNMVISDQMGKLSEAKQAAEAYLRDEQARAKRTLGYDRDAENPLRAKEN